MPESCEWAKSTTHPHCWFIISRLIQRNLQHFFHAIGVVASNTQPKIAISKLHSVTIAKVCRSKSQRGQHQQGPGSSATAKPGRTHHVDEVSTLAEVEDSAYSLYHVTAGTAAPIWATVKVNGANHDWSGHRGFLVHHQWGHISQLVAIQPITTTANREGPEQLYQWVPRGPRFSVCVGGV